MSQRMRQSLSAFAIALSLSACNASEGPEEGGLPAEYELERVVGHQLETTLRVEEWRAAAPRTANLVIYKASPYVIDDALLHRVADHFGVVGEVTKIPGDTGSNWGYWIRDSNATATGKSPTVSFWVTTGKFSYDTGDNGYRYDKASKRHLIEGVPDKEDAKRMALELLPVLGLGISDLDHDGDGRLRWASSAPTITYTDRAEGKRKSLVIARNVTFFQRVPEGGVTTGVGDGGQIAFRFVSKGKVASIEWLFRKMVTAGTARLKSKEEIIECLKNKDAWTWHQNVPASITVTNCVLAYPQGNSWLSQEYVWPFYMVSGTSGNQEAVTVFVPLKAKSITK